MDDEGDGQPFVLDGDYPTFAGAFPSVADLTVTVQSLTLAHEVERTRQYDEVSLPGHVECPNCGHDTAVGWYVADLVDAGETEFRVTVQCQGLARVGRDCPYGYRVEGTVEYE
jgi:hypothetical protein